MDEISTNGQHRNSVSSPPQLHLLDLIRDQRWDAVVKSLVSRNSIDNIDSSSDCNSITYLHVACATPSVPIHVIQAIIRKYPQTCLTEDEDGSLPIHKACSTPGMHLQAIETLMIASPKSCLRRENNEGELPINLLFEKDRSSNFVRLVSHLISRIPASCIYDETTSLIHNICNNILPEGIINQILEMYPQVCRIQHNNGDTLLHILCSHDDAAPRIIRMVIDLQPELCTKQDNEGNIPLHLVSSRNQPEEIIMNLLNAYSQGMCIPNALEQMSLPVRSMRDSPTKVKAMYSDSDRSGLRRMLCIQNKRGLTPVQCFYYNMQCCLSRLMVSSRNISLPSLNLECYPELKSQIKLVHYLKTAYVYGSIDKIKPKRNLMVPHQLCFWTTFPLFTILILRVAPYLAKVKDCNGEFPLHIVAKEVIDKHDICQCSVCNIIPITGPFLRHNGGLQICAKCSKNTCFCPSSDFRIISTPLVEYQNHEVIKHILIAHPEAASIPDRVGNLPLHISLRAGKTWYTGVKEIFEAAPNAIHVQDRTWCQFPFMIAASKRLNDNCCPAIPFYPKQHETESSHQNVVNLLELTTVFELLRRNPCAVDSKRQNET